MVDSCQTFIDIESPAIAGLFYLKAYLLFVKIFHLAY